MCRPANFCVNLFNRAFSGRDGHNGFCFSFLFIFMGNYPGEGPQGGTERGKGGTALPALLLGLAVLACLLPFVNKAFNVDDPVYIWIARHIQRNPLDFFSFNMNWRGVLEPVWRFNENPPLSSYYIAAVAGLFGWSEAALHMAFFAFAVAAAIGTYYLARELCQRPLTAALAGALTPVFIISATTVMSDMMMTAFWVWAVFLWMRGLGEKSVPYVLLASLLVAASSLSEYVGVSLVPLLLIYSLAKKQGRWAWFLLIPAATLAGYDRLTYALYGKDLLLNAASYAVTYQGKGFLNFMTGLVFVGGGLISAFFYSFFIWRKRTLIAGALAMAALMALFPARDFLALFPTALARYRDDPAFHWLFIGQFYVFALGGASALAAAFSDLWNSRDAEALLLFSWTIGIFVFLCLLNWTINSRTVLLMFPALGVLLMRTAGRAGLPGKPAGRLLVIVPLVPSLIIALTVARADYDWAGSQRAAAVSISGNYQGQGKNLWFMGHWGFQYYMEKLGGKPVDRTRTVVQPGDTLVIPANNCYVLPPFLFARYTAAPEVRTAQAGWAATMDPYAGAGFYGDKVSGPLPYIIAPVPGEQYFILTAVRRFAFSPPSDGN